MQKIRDRDLMLQVSSGDISKLGLLFERYHVQLYNFFFRLTYDRQASEDLVQEVFLRMLKYRHTYRGESRFALWMFRIARNSLTDMRRKKKPVGSLDDSPIEHASTDPLPSDRVAYGQEVELLHKALARLPDDKREVLVLSRFHDMKYHEIADLLDCTVGSIKLRAHRAVKELREQFLTLSREPHT